MFGFACPQANLLAVLGKVDGKGSAPGAGADDADLHSVLLCWLLVIKAT